MIEADPTQFPGNVVIKVADALALIDPEVLVFMRPLTPNDGIQALAVYPVDMEPVDESQEMRGQVLGGQVPTLTDYRINIASMVVHSDQAIGLAQSAALAKRVWATVARNVPLDVALKTLAHVGTGYSEHVQRWKTRRQVFQSGDLQGYFLYVSVSELWLQTEIR